jgi:hypothetical protein
MASKAFPTMKGLFPSSTPPFMTEEDHIQGDSVLANIVKRPAMYWGNSNNHFHSFVAFLSGYQIARSEMLGEEARTQLDQVIPPRFHEFVTEYFGHSFPYGGYGWTTFIEENTASDREALDLFMKLRRLYDEKLKGEQDGDAQPAT